jgi:hypothetical protein
MKSGVWDEKGRVQCGERWNDEGHTVSLLWLGCDLVAAGGNLAPRHESETPIILRNTFNFTSPCPSSSTVQHITGIHNNRVTRLIIKVSSTERIKAWHTHQGH